MIYAYFDYIENEVFETRKKLWKSPADSLSGSAFPDLGLNLVVLEAVALCGMLTEHIAKLKMQSLRCKR